MDGFRCLYARRLEPATKRPLGEAFAVYHFHAGRLRVLPSAIFGPAILPDGVILSVFETSSNVWLAEEE